MPVYKSKTKFHLTAEPEKVQIKFERNVHSEKNNPICFEGFSQSIVARNTH